MRAWREGAQQAVQRAAVERRTARRSRAALDAATELRLARGAWRVALGDWRTVRLAHSALAKARTLADNGANRG